MCMCVRVHVRVGVGVGVGAAAAAAAAAGAGAGAGVGVCVCACVRACTLLELLWQIRDILNRRLRFSDGPIRCRHKCQGCENKCCFQFHSISQEEQHSWYGPHKCFLHDDAGYEHLRESSNELAVHIRVK